MCIRDSLYTVEISVYANNRTGLLVDISKIFTERKIDLAAMNVRTSKQGTASIDVTFDVHNNEELNSIIAVSYTHLVVCDEARWKKQICAVQSSTE